MAVIKWHVITQKHVVFSDNVVLSRSRTNSFPTGTYQFQLGGEKCKN